MAVSRLNHWKESLRSYLYGCGLSIQFISARKRARFLEVPSLRRNDTFMCSYPRSGNTWTRMIIACLLDPGVHEVDLHLIDRLVPDAGATPTLDVPVRVFKQHRPDFDVFPRVIYNVRDGRDALLSAYAYACRALGFEGQLLDFIANRKVQVFGFWHEHVESALRFQSRYPNRFLMVRYEQIHDQPEIVIGHLADFLGIHTPERRVEEIVEITRLDNVRKPDETCSDPRYKHTLRQGQVGAWKGRFSELELGIVEGMLGPTLRRLGYPPVFGSADS